MKLKLTKKSVEGLAVGSSGKRYMDTVLEGFGVKVSSKGRRTYFIRYRINGEQFLYSIGPHGQGWTVEKARTEAQKLFGLVAGGKNPLIERNAPLTSETICEFCDQYIEAMENGTLLTRFGTPKKQSTLATDKGRIERHIKPLLGKKIVEALTRRDVEIFRDSVTQGKTAADEKTKLYGRAIVKGGAGTATRTLGLLGSIMAFAIEQGLRSDNPVHGVRRAADKTRNRAISREEYSNIGAEISRAREEGINPLTLDAVTILMLTGCRKGEIAGLQWHEFDADHSCFRFDDTKTGKQIRPIGKCVVDIISNLPKLSNKYVFPAVSGESPTSALPKIWNIIRERVRLPDVTMHTFRHGFASVAGELGYSELTIAGMLGHKSHSITSRYVHVVDRALVDAANNVSNEIAERAYLV